MGTFLSRGPAGEATCMSKAGDDGGLKGTEKRCVSPNWETVEEVVNHDKTDARSYADVVRAGVEKGKMSQLRLRHFTKQPRETPKDKEV